MLQDFPIHTYSAGGNSNARMETEEPKEEEPCIGLFTDEFMKEMEKLQLRYEEEKHEAKTGSVQTSAFQTKAIEVNELARMSGHN
jgi:hypothetical protein